jgi:hypothetical protein
VFKVRSTVVMGVSTELRSFESELEPFEGPIALVDGANDRLSQLETLCKAVSETRDYEINVRADPNTKEKIVKIRLKRRLPPKIRALASMILKDLRLSLDQAFCEGAEALGPCDVTRLYFPFGKDMEDLERQIKRCCRGVDQRLIDYSPVSCKR